MTLQGWHKGEEGGRQQLLKHFRNRPRKMEKKSCVYLNICDEFKVKHSFQETFCRAYSLFFARFAFSFFREALFLFVALHGKSYS